MAIKIPNGTTLEVAATYAASGTITAISNAAAAVVTAANTLANNDYVELLSGWDDLNNGIYKVSAVSGTGFTLAGVDTTGTNFPAGLGVGSFRKVSTFLQIPEITQPQFSGGDTEMGEVQYLAASKKTKFQTIKAPLQFDFEMNWSNSAASLALLQAADQDDLQRGVRMTFKDGAVMTFSAFVSVNQAPNGMKVNENMTRKVMMQVTSNLVNY